MGFETTSSDRKVPFGLQVVTGQLVDVSEVSRGNSCGCICPSCRVPLVAAHGEEVTWYFRHETRQTYDQVIDSCDFSLWAALVLLGRQQLSSAAFFQTPHYVIADGGRPETWRLPPRIVTEARALTPTSVEIEVSAQGTKFDALMTIEGFQL